MRTKIRRYILVVIIAIFNLNMAFADTPSPNPPPPGNIPVPPNEVPLDSSVVILFVLALILGFYFISEKRQTFSK